MLLEGNNITDNGCLCYDWSNKYKSSFIDIFNMSRMDYTENHEESKNTKLYEQFKEIYNYDKNMFVALMFYTRNIRTQKNNIPKGKGERDISYIMALWLLKNDSVLFDKNIFLFVSELGCYKDCLLMAKIAKNIGYSNKLIDKILLPMAVSLIQDDFNIVKSFIEKTPQKKISLASKWAPREGKAYSEFIPNLKRLCQIFGKHSNANWRKLIRSIINKTQDPILIETLLSSKKYESIEFSKIPSKAFNLYKNHFKKNDLLKDRFNNFISQVLSKDSIQNIKINTNTLHPHEITKSYITPRLSNAILDNIVEAQWKCYIKNTLSKCLDLSRESCNFIPMIDISESMCINNNIPITVALSLGILLSQINTGFMQGKAITFSEVPIIYDIVGETLCDKINCIFNELNKPENECGSKYNTNFLLAFKCLLNYCIEKKLPVDCLADTKVIALSDMEFDNCGNITALESIKLMFDSSGYIMPKLIFWNLNGKLKSKPCKLTDNCITLGGFEPAIIDEFIKTGLFTPETLAFNVVKKYLPLVS